MSFETSSLTDNLNAYISTTKISTDCTVFKLGKHQQHLRGQEAGKKIWTFISHSEFPVQSARELCSDFVEKYCNSVHTTLCRCRMLAVQSMDSYKRNLPSGPGRVSSWEPQWWYVPGCGPAQGLGGLVALAVKGFGDKSVFFWLNFSKLCK